LQLNASETRSRLPIAPGRSFFRWQAGRQQVPSALLSLPSSQLARRPHWPEVRRVLPSALELLASRGARPHWPEWRLAPSGRKWLSSQRGRPDWPKDHPQWRSCPEDAGARPPTAPRPLQASGLLRAPAWWWPLLRSTPATGCCLAVPQCRARQPPTIPIGPASLLRSRGAEERWLREAHLGRALLVLRAALRALRAALRALRAVLGQEGSRWRPLARTLSSSQAQGGLLQAQVGLLSSRQLSPRAPQQAPQAPQASQAPLALQSPQAAAAWVGQPLLSGLLWGLPLGLPLGLLWPRVP